MKQLKIVKVKGETTKLPGNVKDIKIFGIKTSISLERLLNYIKKKKYRKV